MAFWGKYLLVANTYSDSISVIDTTSNREVRKIDLGLPIGVPGERPTGLWRRTELDRRRCREQHRLRRALQRQRDRRGRPQRRRVESRHGHDPGRLCAEPRLCWTRQTTRCSLPTTRASAPRATGWNRLRPDTAENSYAKYYGVSDFNTHQDLGTVSIVPVPNLATLWAMTQQVFQNNHWDLAENILSASGGNRFARPVAIPNKIGDPSLIKHVFLIIRENRTYDQMLGDVAAGNGDASLAVFGDNSTYAEYPVVTPNAHTLVQRFPLLDNFYDPSRQSADGHNWITQAMAPYSDDIQSPDWLRDYPSNGGDAIAYQKKGHLWDQAVKAGVSFKNYGEYIEYNTFNRARMHSNLTQANGYNGAGYADSIAVSCFGQLRAELDPVLQRHIGIRDWPGAAAHSTTTPSARSPRSRT